MEIIATCESCKKEMVEGDERHRTTDEIDLCGVCWKEAQKEAKEEPENINTLEIIKRWLKENGYDGLLCTEVPCGCLLEDLNPCGSEDLSECSAAYRHECKKDCHEGACDSEPGKGSFCMRLKKEK